MEAMPYAKFFPLSVISAFVWTFGCTLAGYFLGQIPYFKDNFEILILGVLGLSVVFIIIESIKHRRAGQRSKRDKLADVETS